MNASTELQERVNEVRRSKYLVTPFRCLYRATGFVGAALGVGTSKPKGLNSRSKALPKAYYLQEKTQLILQINGTKMIVTGELPSKPCMVVSNHLGYLDPVILTALIPSAPIAKSEVRKWPIVGRAADEAGVLFVNRESAHSGATTLRKAIRTIQEGGSVLVFPEGTTTSGDQVLPFKRGIFGAAKIAGCDIVPVAIKFADVKNCWVGDDPFLPHYMRLISQPEQVVHVHVCPPMRPSGCAQTDSRNARNIVLDELRKLP